MIYAADVGERPVALKRIDSSSGGETGIQRMLTGTADTRCS